MNKITLLSILFSIVLSNCKNDSKSESIDDSGTKTTITLPKLESINYYLENSGSMNGYVSGNSEFKRANIKLLSDIALRLDNEDSIKINLVNMDIYPYEGSYSNFNEFLTINGIPEIGDVTNSDINLIFENILENSKSTEISILTTDAIYSLNNKGSELGCEGLISQLETKGLETRNLFYKKLSDSNLSMLVLKLKSDFNGKYYPAQGGYVNINQTRPYYMFFFGNSYLLKELNDELSLNELPGYIEDVFVLKTNPFNIDYSILEYGDGQIGEFQNANARQYPIHEIEFESIEKRGEFIGEFGFGVCVDLSNVPLPDLHLMNKSIYKVSSDNYQIYDIVDLKDNNLSKRTTDLINSKEQRTLSKYSHVLFLKTKEKFIQDFSINLVNNVPSWINETGVDCDDNIINDNSKTFGFNKLTNGVIEAYEEINSSKNHFSITIKVKN